MTAACKAAEVIQEGNAGDDPASYRCMRAAREREKIEYGGMGSPMGKKGRRLLQRKGSKLKPPLLPQGGFHQVHCVIFRSVILFSVGPAEQKYSRKRWPP